MKFDKTLPITPAHIESKEFVNLLKKVETSKDNTVVDKEHDKSVVEEILIFRK